MTTTTCCCLVKLVTEDPPDGATRWTMEALAEAMAAHGVPISASQAWRICKSLDLKPWQVESWMTSHDPDFWAKASDVCGLYLNPPQNAVVWSVDEKSGMQAKSRINPTKPAIPGKRDAPRVRVQAQRHRRALRRPRRPRRRHRRMGHRLDPLGELRRVLGRPGAPDAQGPRPALHRRQPRAPTRPARSLRFLEDNPHVHIHYTPTHASWLNQVELFFSILERRLLRRGEFASVDELAERDHRLHQGLQPKSGAVPLDLRRPPLTSRVSHNDFTARALVVAKVFCIRPEAVPWHIKPIGHGLTPLRCHGGLTPVVGGPHDFSILQLTNGDVPVQATVSVVAGPFDYDDIIEVQAPPDFQREFGKVAFDIGNQLPRAHDLAHLRPLANDLLCQGHAKDVSDASRPIGILTYFGHAITSSSS